jgi:L-ascorbate metabolism protein UlaG (beta-lactamase superfamily)
MRIEKFAHSCLRLTSGGQTLLFDPGKFGFVDGRVDPKALAGANFVLIAHAHPDHLDPAALKIILSAGGQVVGNSEVRDKLAGEGIAVEVFEDGIRQFGAFELRAIPVPHEPILAKETPRVTAFLVNDRLLNCGDSFDDALLAHAGVEVLALPVMAPYLTELKVMAFAKAMRPKFALPLHDGHARDFFVEQRYDTYEPFFREAGIELVRLAEPGDSFNLAE